MLAARAPGGARVRRAGAAAWEPLAAPALLAPGDAVEAAGLGLELALAAADALESAPLGGTRVLLAPGARAELPAVTGGPAVSLAAGEGFVMAAEPVALALGGRTLVVEAGDAGLTAGRRPAVAAWSARVRVADVRVVEPGRALRFGGRPRPLEVNPPAWIGDLLAVDPARALFHEDFAGPVEAATFLGAPRGDGAVNAVLHAVGGNPAVRVVFLAAGGGLARHAAGARVRIRYRLEAAGPLTVQLVCGGATRRAVLARPRVGEWSVVEVPLDGWAAPGDVLDHLTVAAGAPGEDLPFALAEVAIVP